MKKIFYTVTKLIVAIGALIFTNFNKVMGLSIREGVEAARGTDMPAELFGLNGTFTQITDTILFVVGIISVIMLIWGGLRYIISGGDSKKVTDAKNTVLYAIIGLVIAVLAYAIVHFVLNNIGATPTVVE